jgi:hypothetical protein
MNFFADPPAFSTEDAEVVVTIHERIGTLEVISVIDGRKVQLRGRTHLEAHIADGASGTVGTEPASSRSAGLGGVGAMILAVGPVWTDKTPLRMAGEHQFEGTLAKRL